MRGVVTLADLAAIKADTDVEAQAQAEALLWPKGPVCPFCGGVGAAYRINRTRSLWASYWRCADNECGGSFSPKLGTFFQGSTNLTWRQIAAMARALLADPEAGPGALALAGKLSSAAARKYWAALHEVRKAGSFWNETQLALLAQQGQAKRAANANRLVAHNHMVQSRLAREEGLKCPACDSDSFWYLAMESNIAKRPTYRCRWCRCEFVVRDGEAVPLKSQPEIEKGIAPPKPESFYWQRMRQERAMQKMQKDKERFVVITGPNDAPLSPSLQEAARMLGWMINASGHALAPRIDPDYAWRRFCAVLRILARASEAKQTYQSAEQAANLIARAAVSEAKRMAGIQGAAARWNKRLTPEEEQALAAYQGKVRALPPKGKRRSPTASAVTVSKRTEAKAKAAEAVELMIGLGYSQVEAIEAVPGATPSAMRAVIREKRERGEYLGLLGVGANRKRAQTARLRAKKNAPYMDERNGD